MNTDKLFVDGYKLPQPLPKEELYNLIKAAKEGSKEAKDKLVVHNIRLAMYVVNSKFPNVDYDKQDLVSIGNIGLIKAINFYDPSKECKFAAYAARCIENEILLFLRKIKKDQTVDSLDRTVFKDKDGSEIKLEDRISDDIDLVEDYEDAETNKIIREIVKELPDRDREIIMLHFGFYDNKVYKQKEIADKLNICQPCVSRSIKKIVKKIGIILESQGITQSYSKQPKVKKKKKKEDMQKLQTIYEYLKIYTREQVDEILTNLTVEERALVTTRHGEDLDNPVSAKLTKEQTDKFYGTLIPKMKRLLSNSTEERNTRKPKETQEQSAALKLTENREREMTNEDYIKVLELLRTPIFTQMTSVLSKKEVVIISLKLGYIDGKYFSTESIAQFLGIEETEVIEITRKVLLIYKENMNNFLDNAIAVATDQAGQGRALINPQNTRNS